MHVDMIDQITKNLMYFYIYTFELTLFVLTFHQHNKLTLKLRIKIYKIVQKNKTYNMITKRILVESKWVLELKIKIFEESNRT